MPLLGAAAEAVDQESLPIRFIAQDVFAAVVASVDAGDFHDGVRGDLIPVPGEGTGGAVGQPGGGRGELRPRGDGGGGAA
jgi:hypothetical protein